jgi:hypothetical protein
MVRPNRRQPTSELPWATCSAVAARAGLFQHHRPIRSKADDPTGRLRRDLASPGYGVPICQVLAFGVDLGGARTTSTTIPRGLHLCGIAGRLLPGLALLP